MRKEDVETLKLKDLKHVLTPLKRGRVLKDYVDVGFDTEFTAEDNSADRELLSLQFSLGRGRSGIYYINRKAGITSHELLDYTLKFLAEQGVEPRKHIFLIAHFAIAELSKISDFYDEYMMHDGIMMRPKVSEFNKAILWQRRFEDVFADTVTLHIADLFGHMKTSLDKVGAAVGYQKLKIEVDGLDDHYWKLHMKELQLKHPEIYDAYAVRDAEVAIEAWRSIVETYKQLNLDPHCYGTYTSITVAAFRRIMTKLPCPAVEEKILIRQKMPHDVWREHIAKKLSFSGDLNARELAVLSYWGGNNQAFARGYFPDIEASYYDFKSLYIIAGILQPLSNEDTVYQPIDVQDVKDGAEGFCEVEFKFPEGTMYPTLPVQENYYPKLMFPLRGKSYCTLSELRQALTLGVNITKFRSYGFMPTDNEINNELRPFLADMLKKKSMMEASGKRDSTDYQIEKAKMVGIIGRFAYMKPSHTAEDIARLLHVSGLESESFRKYGKKKAMRALYTRSEVGGSWCIEWASLILGKARSMAGWAINQGERCLTISTDGGFWLSDPLFEKSDVSRELGKFYSGIRREGSIDELWIGRNRCYVAWYQGKLVHAAQGGIAVSGSSDEKKLNFEKMVRESLAARKEIIFESETTRLTGLMDYIHDNVPLNSAQHKVKKISWAFDGKRKLDREVNVFAENTFTKPYDTVEEAYRHEFGIGKAGRPHELDEKVIAEIKAAGAKFTHKVLAEKYDVSISTIRRIRGAQNCSI
jgi:hypothetical protein